MNDAMTRARSWRAASAGLALAAAALLTLAACSQAPPSLNSEPASSSTTAPPATKSPESQEAKPAPSSSAWKPKSDRDRDRDSSSPSPSESPEPEQTSSAKPDSGPAIQSCGELFPSSTLSELSGRGLALNPSDLSKGLLSTGPSFDDSSLTTLAQDRLDLACYWVHTSGGDDFATPKTWVMRGLSGSEQDRVIATYVAEGGVCLDADGGMRCTREYSSQGMDAGLSSYLRDGVWLHTHWAGVPPTSYTPGMVGKVWG